MNQSSPEHYSFQEQVNYNEISLLDILIFLKRSYKFIALIGLLGVAASFGYLQMTPKKYQASAQIQMAKIFVANSSNIDGISSLTIEEPSLLINRLLSPTSYNGEVIKACGLDSVKNAQTVLSKSVKLTILKGVPNTVDMKIIGASPDNAIVCAQAVFDLIKVTQAQMVKQHIEAANAKFFGYQQRIAQLEELLARVEKIGLPLYATDPMRDEIRSLLDNKNTQKKFYFFGANGGTHLIAPIYISDDPINPKNGIVLLAGLFGGLFLGLLIAFGRHLITNIKAQIENNTQSK